ncbi:PIN domain-containing protein [Streptomyces sp. NPDC096153]|uniref:PIN domain-containing protein n=1 Tax=Streptomyces sp. NPDC096153 TaxID=3155548 RepID=UPI00332BFD2F
MIYLLDTSALVRLLASRGLAAAWRPEIEGQVMATCSPQRTEFLYSARGGEDFDRATEMFAALHPDVAVPKNANRWAESVQYRMSRNGHHRSASAVDLLIAATAAHHGLTVLHDDGDYATIARHAPELTEHNVHDVPLR